MDSGLSKEVDEDTKNARTVQSVWSVGGRARCGVRGGVTVAIRELERGQKRQVRMVGIRTLEGGDTRKAGILGNDKMGTEALKVGSLDQQHGHCLGTWEKCIFSGRTPDLLNQKPWGRAQSL